MSRESKKPPKDRTSPAPARTDRLYGNIPLIPHRTTVAGKTYEWWECDPAYQPPLPRGAVRGDVAKQVFCSACHTPKYFYVDETRRCIQCGASFTFSGREQKYWYETRQFNFNSVPVRCARCRRLRRTEHALREQVGRARAAVRRTPDDPAAQLALASAIIELHERTDQGALDDAVAAARKAAKLWRGVAEASLWEGIAHLRAGREKQGRACLTSFVESASPTPAALRAKARSYLG